MKIDKINLLNIDDLYEAVVNKQNDKDYHSRPFGMNLPQFLSHMTIMFDISEINEFEYIFMKNYVRTISPFIYDMKTDYVKKQFEEVYDLSVEPLLSTLRNILDNNPNKSVSSLLPLGFITGRTTVVLSGESISLITGLDPTLFFLKYKATLDIVEQPGRENKLDMEMKELLSSESFINFLISNFINNFYKFMLDKMMMIDPASEAFNHSMYLNKYKPGVNVLSIQSYDFLINFTMSDTVALLSKLDEFKENHKGENTLHLLQTINIEFGMFTDVEVFFELYNTLPFDRFTSIENFVSINDASMKSTPVIPSFATTYEKRINSRINSLKDMISKSYADKSSLMKKLMLTFGYTKMKYTINISLFDYMMYIEKMDTSFLDGNSLQVFENIHKWCKAFRDKLL